MAKNSRGDLHVPLQSKCGAGRIAGGWAVAAPGEAARYDPAESTGTAGCAALEPGIPGVSDTVRGAAEAGQCDPGKTLNGSEEERLGAGGAMLLEQPERLAGMKSAARQMARPEAASRIVEDALGLLH